MRSIFKKIILSSFVQEYIFPNILLIHLPIFNIKNIFVFSLVSSSLQEASRKRKIGILIIPRWYLTPYVTPYFTQMIFLPPKSLSHA